jgi:hypothetical protein
VPILALQFPFWRVFVQTCGAPLFGFPLFLLLVLPLAWKMRRDYKKARATSASLEKVKESKNNMIGLSIISALAIFFNIGLIWYARGTYQELSIYRKLTPADVAAIRIYRSHPGVWLSHLGRR